MQRMVPSPCPGTRAYLLQAGLGFVREARQVPGVGRIALLGSLLTPKAEPKDIDLLVSVDAQADLTELARLGRRLKGHAQQRNKGADIFLADLQHQYIGRTCSWKVCAPGVRMSCDARHCARRAHLHDDLDAITLAPALTQAPPVELWPQRVCRVPVPEDVARLLLEPLAHDATTEPRAAPKPDGR